MTAKLNREAILVIVMSVMILFGAFYYGNLYLVQPISEEADSLTATVDTRKSLVDQYPPSEELLAEYEEAYLATESYLPLGDLANQALITIEERANQSDVTISSVSRSGARQSIEGVPSNFVKNTYAVAMTAESPNDFRSLINRLMEEERVWNIPSFTYNRSGEDSYTGTLTYEIFYLLNSDEPSEEIIDEIVEENVEEENVE